MGSTLVEVGLQKKDLSCADGGVGKLTRPWLLARVEGTIVRIGRRVLQHPQQCRLQKQTSSHHTCIALLYISHRVSSISPQRAGRHSRTNGEVRHGTQARVSAQRDEAGNTES